MKVVPHLKPSKHLNNVIKIITISQSSIEELLLENLLDHRHEYFEIEKSDDSNICLMSWDVGTGLLTYAIMPEEYCTNGYRLDFDYIREKIGITTKSLFSSNRFHVVHLDNEDERAILLPPCRPEQDKR